MSLILEHPHTEVAKVIAFLKDTYKKQGKTKAVIAVSGGIDSALALTLLAHALPLESIFPLFLPFDDQSIEHSQEVCNFNNIPEENIQIINIKETVLKIEDTLFSTKLRLDPKDEVDKYRRGNLMARVRMIFVYDLAKKLDALVCGTENKSEKYLAYFTRFGDEASDIEPIQHLYKTQVRQLARHLNIPNAIIDKHPSAGLWQNQTDEDELGFSYDEADKAIEKYLKKEKAENEVEKKVFARMMSQHFKHEVPYTI